MALQDRDYYRGAEVANPLAGSVVVKLIVLNVVVFLVDLFFFNRDHELTKTLAVHGDTIARPLMWWQFLTAGFAHSWSNVWHLIGNMIGLYIFGRALEEHGGWREFLPFYLLAIVAGTILWSARQYFFVGPFTAIVGERTVELWGFAVGASGGTTALTILYCLRNPQATLQMYFAIPVPAWAAGALLIAADLLGVQPVDGSQRIAFDIHLTGAAFALAYWGLGWNFSRLPGMASLGQMARSLRKAVQPKPDLRVHDPEAYYEDLDEEADKLLEKVNRLGESSLTARERKMLEAYSRRMRQKRS